MDVMKKLVEMLAPTSLNFEEATYLSDCLVNNGVMEAMTMPEYTEKDIFRSAIDTYGAVMQITVAFEEMSELQKELCKYLRGSGSQENIAEEIADVEIMMEQMKMLFNCEAAVCERAYLLIGKKAMPDEEV